MFDQFKEKFQSVQQDLSDGIKSLSVKAQKVSKTNSLPNLRDGLHISAGADLLDSFQGHWTKIHQDIEDCANRAAETDVLIQMITVAQEKQFAEWSGIKRQLQEIPTLLEGIQNITTTIGKLTADFEEVEASLVDLEDVAEEVEYQKNEEIQRKELENYQKQKRHEEELLRAHLQDEFNEKLQAKQNEEDAKMRERQQAFQEFFTDDLKHYKEFGQMHCSMEVAAQEMHLEDYELVWDEHDQQVLNDFLGPPEEHGPYEVDVGSTVEETSPGKSEERNDDGDTDEDTPSNKMEELRDELPSSETVPAITMEKAAEGTRQDRITDEEAHAS